MVDDDTDTRALAVQLLAGIGLTDVQENAGAAGVAAQVAAFDPHLLLLDRHLGAVDGLGVLEELSRTDRGYNARAVLVVTGDGSNDTRRRALALGARGLLMKPFRREEFNNAVRSALSLVGEATPPPETG